MFTQIGDMLAPKKRALRGRRMVAVDIENVVGGAVMTLAQAETARRCIESTMTARDDEQVVLGSSHIGALNAWLAWKGARMLVRSGEDGADLELLKVLEDEHIAERFDEVVLISGDGIFTDTVAALGAVGVWVTVISRPEACSKSLRMAAAATRYLGPTIPTFGEAA